MVEPGTVLDGRYRLVAPAWFDSEAITWAALDLEIGDQVNVRVPMYEPSEFTIASFQRQFDLLSTIEHPGVVRVHATGRDPSVAVYLVTEYFDVVLFSDHAPIAPERTMEMVAQGADAVQAVHDRDVVFRNFWKGILMRTDATMVLNDFHLAGPVGSQELESIVTSNAAAWERPATPLTDIYDLGRLAHYLLTLAYPGDLHERLSPLVWPDHVPPDVRAVVEKAAAINAADRWTSAAALAEAARATLA